MTREFISILILTAESVLLWILFQIKKWHMTTTGNGTCVAGILAGSGAASMGKYKGAAPGCHLAVLKVLDRFGNGNKEDVLKAFDWILRNRQRYNIRIVNISVGTTYSDTE